MSGKFGPQNAKSPDPETNGEIATRREDTNATRDAAGDVSVLQFRPDGEDQQWQPLHSYLYQLKLFYGYDWSNDVPDTGADWGWGF